MTPPGREVIRAGGVHKLGSSQGFAAFAAAIEFPHPTRRPPGLTSSQLPQAPTVLEIGRAISAAFDHEWTEVLLPGAEQDGVGDHPWGAPVPFVLDMTEAERQLGYQPVTNYEQAVRETAHWLVETTRGRDWRRALKHGEQMVPLFGYAAEDAFLERLTTNGTRQTCT